MESEKCIRCGAINSKIINPVSGEEVCENCGIIYDDKIIDETGGNKRTNKNTIRTNITFQSSNLQK